MSNVLENQSDSFEDKRILYVPPSIDWDVMYAHGVKLISQGYSVWMHEHRIGDPCEQADGPFGASRCGRLTSTPNGPKLVPDSEHDEHQN